MSHQYFKDLYENAPLPYQSLSIEGILLIVNPAWLEETGYMEDEVIGRPFSDFVTPESLKTLRNNFPQLCSNGVVHDVEFEIVRKDGSIVHVIFDGKASYSESGEFKQTHCIYKPLMPEEKNDKKGEIEPNFPKMFQNSNSCMIIFDPDTLEIIDVNKKVCNMYGYSYREFVSMSLRDLNVSPAQTKAKVDQFLTGNLESLEVYHVLKNGEIICIESHPSVLNVGGRKYVYSIFQNITKRKESENLLAIQTSILKSFLKGDEATIFSEVLQDLLSFFECEFGFTGYIDEQGKLVCPSMAVDTFESIKDCLWEDFLLDKKINIKTSGLVPPEGDIQLKDVMTVPILSGEVVIGMFAVGNSRNGFSKKNKDNAGNISNILSSILLNWRKGLFSRNEILQHQEHLKDLNKNLEIRVEKEVNQRKIQEQLLFEQKKFVDMGQMINAIAHQWRQPLNNIYIISQIMEDIYKGINHDFSYEELSKQQADLIEHMSKTIDDFRGFFAGDKGAEVYGLVKETLSTLDLVRAQFDAYGISIDVSCKCDETSTFCDSDYITSYCGKGNDLTYGHSGEFKQVVLNIISNARDAILGMGASDFPNEIKIDIFVNSEIITIDFFNYGLPIPEDILPKIFDPYFTTKEDGKGTGIGLYMSKLIIENSMNGKVICENVKDGVNFHLSFPKKVENE